MQGKFFPNRFLKEFCRTIFLKFTFCLQNTVIVYQYSTFYVITMSNLSYSKFWNKKVRTLFSRKLCTIFIFQKLLTEIWCGFFLIYIQQKKWQTSSSPLFIIFFCQKQTLDKCRYWMNELWSPVILFLENQ